MPSTRNIKSKLVSISFPRIPHEYICFQSGIFSLDGVLTSKRVGQFNKIGENGKHVRERDRKFMNHWDYPFCNWRNSNFVVITYIGLVIVIVIAQ